MAVAVQTEKFDVGGVLLDRPFKARRLSHFGFETEKPEETLEFYTRLIGFRLSDPSGGGGFLRCMTDHHSLVLSKPRPNPYNPEMTINQITWHISSLKELADGAAWMLKQNIKVRIPLGRGHPGNNYHFYFFDPEGHVNELCYGLSQTGWTGESKPRWFDHYSDTFSKEPKLPHISAGAEVQEALDQDVDIHSGIRDLDLGGDYDVEGILLPRPFKVTHVGPVRIFVTDMDKVQAWYEDVIGLVKSEEITYHGHRCIFLRANTEHHSLALYPIGLRQELGLRPDSTSMSLGLQVNNYRQLKNAAQFLKEKGCAVRELPAELFPGLGYSIFVTDPVGHAVQLYDYMEQIGWDGQPRPAHLRQPVNVGNWPEALPPQSDTYHGEVFAGPIG